MIVLIDHSFGIEHSNKEYLQTEIDHNKHVIIL